jgi:peptidoglycan/LPS O-acetylase OafA/YrhL
MARRFARLWPLHLCGLVLCFVWLAWLVWNDATDIGWGTLLSGFGANLLFLPSVVGRDISPINPPAWSLLMEFGANALMALFAIRRSTRGLVIMLAVMAVVLVADMTLTQTMTPFEGGTSVANTGYRWHDVHLGVVRTMFSFLFGMVLARSLAGASPRASRWALVAMVAVPVLLLLPLTGWARFGFDLAFILIASPLLVRAGRGCNCPRGGRGWGVSGRSVLSALRGALLLDLSRHDLWLSSRLAGGSQPCGVPGAGSGLRAVLCKIRRFAPPKAIERGFDAVLTRK